MSDIIVKADGLTKHFQAVRAVDGVSFEIARGSVVALLGGNGAGKTTTISMLLGLLTPTGGSIVTLGEDMLRHRYRVLGRINFCSPYVDMPKRLTVRQNLAVYAELYAVAAPRRRIEALVGDLDLGDFVDRPFGSLSSGQKTRVALAKAFLNDPELLYLDEPTASLDPDTADWVRGYLRGYQERQGGTILLASHNMTEVERLCSEVLMMKAGRIVDRGSPAGLIAKYGRDNLEDVFLDIARGRGKAEPARSAAQ